MKKLLCFLLVLITFSFLGSACENKKGVSIYAPDGAPALSLTSFIDKNFENTNVSIIDSKKIGATITGKNPKADICILPINMASTLIGDGKTYKMIGTITHGNFYFLSSLYSFFFTNSYNFIICKRCTIFAP